MLARFPPISYRLLLQPRGATVQWISHVRGSNTVPASRRAIVPSAEMAPSCAQGSVLRVLLLAGPALSHGLPPSVRVGLPPSVLSGLSGPERGGPAYLQTLHRAVRNLKVQGLLVLFIN